MVAGSGSADAWRSLNRDPRLAEIRKIQVRPVALGEDKSTAAVSPTLEYREIVPFIFYELGFGVKNVERF